MPFLSKNDLTSIIYEEDIDTITQGDDSKVDTAIAAGIGEAQAYLGRYDNAALFARVDTTRDPILFESCKAIACWYLVAACAANQNIKDLRERANDARTWLRGIQSGKLKPVGWPAIVPNEKSTFFHVSSSTPKRNNSI